MRSAYLTIDDSASERMDDLVDYLVSKGIPAVFFCRGDMLEANPQAAVRAVKKGFVLANHTYSHQRASNFDADFTIQEIKQCEFLLERIYKEAGVQKSHKYFRYPHVDRGTAGWIIDYDQATPTTKDTVMSEIAAGVNLPDMSKPSPEAFAKKQALQDYLKEAGYTDPFKKVTHGWYNSGEIAQAHDCLFTFSNCDWMLLSRQLGKWPYKTLDDLKKKARQDPWLSIENSVNIIVAHDQVEICDMTIALIDDMVESGIQFIGA